MSDEAGAKPRLIDREQVCHIAYLVRLALTDDEVDMFSEQLSSIVDYFDRLAEMDVAGVLPYCQPQMQRTRLREDKVQSSMRHAAFLANVPHHQDGFVRVPIVLDVQDEMEG